MNRTVFDAGHDAFRTNVSGFLERAVGQHLPDFVAQNQISRDAWLSLGHQGLLGIEVPEIYGGGGSNDYRYSAVFGEELAKISAAVASSVGIHCDVVLPYLLDLCTDDQKERWLPGFCSGETITAIAMTEPSAGSDLAAIQTHARRDGGDWILNGSKTFITNGSSADLVIVAARTTADSRSRGISLFVLEGGMAGFSRGKKLKKLGQPEADTAELFFNDLRIPQGNLLGRPDEGFRYMMERLPRERLSAAVSNVSHAIQAFSDTVIYVKERRAFGTAIGSFQANKFRLAELQTKLSVTQSFVDACINAFNLGTLSPIDAAQAKLWSSDVQNETLDACVQLHGGYGYMSECRVAQAWVDGRVTRIWAGSNEIMKEVIGRSMGL